MLVCIIYYLLKTPITLEGMLHPMKDLNLHFLVTARKPGVLVDKKRKVVHKLYDTEKNVPMLEVARLVHKDAVVTF